MWWFSVITVDGFRSPSDEGTLAAARGSDGDKKASGVPSQAAILPDRKSLWISRQHRDDDEAGVIDAGIGERPLEHRFRRGGGIFWASGEGI